jgi:hypothetical protein
MKMPARFFGMVHRRDAERRGQRSETGAAANADYHVKHFRKSLKTKLLKRYRELPGNIPGSITVF